MNAHEKCDLQGPNDFIKMLKHELKLKSSSIHELKSSSRNPRRHSIGGRKSRKNGKMYKQKGGMNKEHVKFAVKCFIYLIFILVSGNGCVRIYTNIKFLSNVALKLGITVEVLIAIISVVTTTIQTDYKQKPIIRIPFDLACAVMAGNVYGLKQIIDVVIFFAKSNYELNLYLEQQIEQAFNTVEHVNFDNTEHNHAAAQTQIVNTVSSFGEFIGGVIRQRQLKNDDFDNDDDDYKEVVVEQRLNSLMPLPTSRHHDPDKVLREKRRHTIMNDDLDVYRREGPHRRWKR
jgi:hypothetical protein